MKLSVLAAATLAVSLFSCFAFARAIVSGPLGDSQLVRGKKLGMSYLHYGASGAASGVTVTASYGFYGTTGATTVMNPTGYGNQVAFMDVPSDAAGFWYTLSVSDGTILSDNGQPFAIPVHDRALSVKKVAPTSGTLVVKYSGLVTTTYDTFMHLGWNDWHAVGDAFMSRTEFSYGKAGVYYDYNYVNIDAPWWANYLDFVFKDARGGGSWDNNDGADWHKSLRPFVTTSVNPLDGTTLTVTITYADGGLNPVVVRWGTDGWDNVTDTTMQAITGGYQVWLQVPADAQTLEYAFWDGDAHWENNFGMNWSVALH